MNDRVPAGWLPDPTKRFEHRYWDGSRWTEHVARFDEPFSDPLLEEPPVPAARSAKRHLRETPVDEVKRGGLVGFMSSMWRGFRRTPVWAQITMVAIIVLLVIAAAVALSGGGDQKGASNNGESKSAAAASTPAQTSPPSTIPTTTLAPTTTTAAPPGFSGDGTYVVGETVQPGLYVSTGNTLCSWERATDATGNPDSIIEKESTGGQELVQLNASEVFTTQGCARWTVFTPLAQPIASAGDGTWAVPSQITPGTWQSSGGSSCSWARLNNFAGDVDSIAASDNTDGPAVVDIQDSDVAFRSAGCGTWTKAE